MFLLQHLARCNWILDHEAFNMVRVTVADNILRDRSMNAAMTTLLTKKLLVIYNTARIVLQNGP